MAVQDEQFLVLGGAKSVDEHCSPSADILRALGEYRFDELGSQVAGRHPWSRADSGLAVDPKPEVHVPSSTVNSGRSAPGIVQPWKATPKEYVAALAARITRSTSSRFAPFFRRCRSDLVHREGACDAAPFLLFVRLG